MKKSGLWNFLFRKHTISTCIVKKNWWSWRWSIFQQNNFICRSPLRKHEINILIIVRTAFFLHSFGPFQFFRSFNMEFSFVFSKRCGLHACMLRTQRNKHSIISSISKFSKVQGINKLQIFDGSWLKLIHILILRLDLMPPSSGYFYQNHHQKFINSTIAFFVEFCVTRRINMQRPHKHKKEEWNSSDGCCSMD